MIARSISLGLVAMVLSGCAVGAVGGEQPVDEPEASGTPAPDPVGGPVGEPEGKEQKDDAELATTKQPLCAGNWTNSWECKEVEMYWNTKCPDGSPMYLVAYYTQYYNYRNGQYFFSYDSLRRHQWYCGVAQPYHGCRRNC